MFSIFRKKQKNPAPAPGIDLIIDARLLACLQERAAAEGLSVADAAVRFLRRGIEDYWLHVANAQQEDYQSVIKLHERAERDNRLLRVLEAQNIRYNELLAAGNTKGEVP